MEQKERGYTLYAVWKLLAVIIFQEISTSNFYIFARQMQSIQIYLSTQTYMIWWRRPSTYQLPYINFTESYHCIFGLAFFFFKVTQGYPHIYQSCTSPTVSQFHWHCLILTLNPTPSKSGSGIQWADSKFITISVKLKSQILLLPEWIHWFSQALVWLRQCTQLPSQHPDHFALCNAQVVLLKVGKF